MKLLDCGCGQETLTLDFAHTLTEGAVIGIDLEPSQIQAAESEAVEAGITNAQFHVANFYQLPFPRASYDAVFANTVTNSVVSEPKREPSARNMSTGRTLPGQTASHLASSIQRL